MKRLNATWAQSGIDEREGFARDQIAASKSLGGLRLLAFPHLVLLSKRPVHYLPLTWW